MSARVENSVQIEFAGEGGRATRTDLIRRFEIRDFRFCGCRASRQVRVRKVNSGTKTVLLGLVIPTRLL